MEAARWDIYNISRAARQRRSTAHHGQVKMPDRLFPDSVFSGIIFSAGNILQFRGYLEWELK
jgi:hypothetical protein